MKPTKKIKPVDEYAKGCGKVDMRIFAPSLAIILAVTIPLCFHPSLGQALVLSVRDFVIKNFGWLFLWVPVLCLGIIAWLSFGKYGDIKLGGPEEKTEFSSFAWISMLFCCGVGSSSIVWGVCEPIYYIDGPPLGLVARSRAAYEIALALPSFHWGLSAWAIYALAALGMAYSLYVRRKPALRLSTAAEGFLGSKNNNGLFSVFLEILVVIGSVGGFGVSLGLGVPFVAEFLSASFGLENNLWLKGAVIFVWTLIFSLSVFRGVAKGMQVLSKINIWLVIFVLAFVFFAGPTMFTLESLTNSVGLLFQNFFSLSFGLEPFKAVAQNPAAVEAAKSSNTFAQDWTIYYWCWWIALAPISGIFLGRISRGRTIRQVLLGITFWGSLGCALTLGILGAYSIHLEYTNVHDVSKMLSDFGTGPTAAKVLMTLPYSQFLVPVYIVLAMVFLATTLDAAAFSLAAICTKNIKGDEQPARWQRLLWALVLGGFSMGILITGGSDGQSLKTIQTSAIAAGLPLLIVLIAVVWALIKNLRQKLRS